MTNVLDKLCRENLNIQLRRNGFFPKSCLLRDNVEKCGTVRQATDDNIIRTSVLHAG